MVQIVGLFALLLFCAGASMWNSMFPAPKAPTPKAAVTAAAVVDGFKAKGVDSFVKNVSVEGSKVYVFTYLSGTERRYAEGLAGYIFRAWPAVLEVVVWDGDGGEIGTYHPNASP
jgi:hypothetical protein